MRGRVRGEKREERTGKMGKEEARKGEREVWKREWGEK